VGQLVCCVVTALLGKESSGGKKAARVELSLRLSKLHGRQRCGPALRWSVFWLGEKGWVDGMGWNGARVGGLNDEQQTKALGS
jgi:hypothetical protein